MPTIYSRCAISLDHTVSVVGHISFNAKMESAVFERFCGPLLYGVVSSNAVQFVSCDQISLLYPLLYGVAPLDIVILLVQN